MDQISDFTPSLLFLIDQTRGDMIVIISMQPIPIRIGDKILYLHSDGDQSASSITSSSQSQLSILNLLDLVYTFDLSLHCYYMIEMKF